MPAASPDRKNPVPRREADIVVVCHVRTYNMPLHFDNLMSAGFGAGQFALTAKRASPDTVFAKYVYLEEE
jgi:hypothetical protein